MKGYLQNIFDVEKLAGVFDEIPFWSAPFGIKLLDSIDYKPGLTVLDIGFGTGFPLTEVAMRLGNESVVYGIDPSKPAIKRAKKKIKLWGITNIRIIEGCAESIPLGNHSVDLILSNNGINNVQNVGKVISECSRIIKTGGKFIQTMNTDKTMTEFYDEFRLVLSEMGLSNESELLEKHIYEKRKPVAEVTSIIEQNGFLVENVENECFRYRFSNGTAMLNHFFIRLAFMGSWISILPEEKIEAVFEKVEERLNAKSFPNGFQLTIPFVLIKSRKK